MSRHRIHFVLVQAYILSLLCIILLAIAWLLFKFVFFFDLQYSSYVYLNATVLNFLCTCTAMLGG